MAHAQVQLVDTDLDRNSLLNSLNPADKLLILPHLEHLPLSLRDVLFEPREIIRYCHFPFSGVVSMTVTMENGDTTEVGLIGKEGFVGAAVVLGDSCMEHQAIVQVAGDGVRIRAKKMQELVLKSESLRMTMLCFVCEQLGLLAHTVACNALHSAEQRLSRWLLMFADRTGTDVLPITHDFLAMMIGTRRATVTEVADRLERSGSLQLKRGEVRILDRKLLEQAACECYLRMKEAVAAACA